MIVQTLVPDAPAIVLAARHDADGFLAGELERRARAALPAVLDADPHRLRRAGPGRARRRGGARARLPGRARARAAVPPARQERSQVVIKAQDRAAAVAAVGAAVARSRRGASTAASRCRSTSIRSEPASRLDSARMSDEHPQDASRSRPTPASASRARPGGRRAPPRGARPDRQFGDPVLKSKGQEITVFDDALRAEIARMAELMDDALGIGLAANQVGRLKRLLVYSVEPDSPVQALVNPRDRVALQGAGGLRGGLPEPRRRARRRRASGPRARARAGRQRRADPDRGLGTRGARHPARDGPPRRRPDPRPRAARPAPRGDAGAARARGRRGRARRGRVRTVYLGTSEFAAGVLRRLADARRTARARRDAARRAGRSRAAALPAAGRRLAAELGLELFQPEDVGSPESRERIAAAEPDVLLLCAYGALIKEPLLSEHEILNVHPSLLPRWRGAAPVERAILAGDERTGVSIMRLTAGLDSGPVCLQGRRADRPRRRLRDARGAARGARSAAARAGDRRAPGRSPSRTSPA